MRRMSDEELKWLQEHWRLGTVAGKERRHLIGFNTWDYNALCGVQCHVLLRWTENPRLVAMDIKKLCPVCRRRAKEKGKSDKGTGT